VTRPAITLKDSHNGDELTADDVVFTYTQGRMIGEQPVVAAGKRFMGTVSHAEKLGKYRVRIVSKEPDVMLEQRMAGYASWIVNAREYLMKGKEQYMREPIGTGPYKLDAFVDGEYVRLVAHDDYFGGTPPPPPPSLSRWYPRYRRRSPRPCGCAAAWRFAKPAGKPWICWPGWACPTPPGGSVNIPTSSPAA
jgi:hypothetical protein